MSGSTVCVVDYNVSPAKTSNQELQMIRIDIKVSHSISGPFPSLNFQVHSSEGLQSCWETKKFPLKSEKYTEKTHYQ